MASVFAVEPGIANKMDVESGMTSTNMVSEKLTMNDPHPRQKFMPIEFAEIHYEQDSESIMRSFR